MQYDHEADQAVFAIEQKLARLRLAGDPTPPRLLRLRRLQAILATAIEAAGGEITK